MKINDSLDVGGPAFFRNVAYFYGGVVNSGGESGSYAAKTGAYTIGEGDNVIDCTSGTFTVTLPTAVGIAGRKYVIKNSGTGTITVDGSGSETLDGATTAVLRPGKSCITIQSNGTNWIIIGVISPVSLA